MATGETGTGMAALSLWHDTLDDGDDLEPRPPLPGDCDVDVAIVGAGFTGLWTAYYLRRADPTLRVVVLEREQAGFGASGRNGGWCVADQGISLATLERDGGPGAAQAMVREMHRTVDEVGAVVARENIDCGFAKGGAIYVATNPAQMRRLHRRQEKNARYRVDDAYEVLDRRQALAVVDYAGALGGLLTPHAAALHPARLARGLAFAVEANGGVVHEQTSVRSFEPGRVHTDHGAVRAPVVVRATEAYTSTISGHERDLLPLANYMVATEPLDDDTWAGIGLARRELFEESATMLGYGQRTADGRIAWGGLSAPYSWGSRIPPSPMSDRRVQVRLERSLVSRFPALAGVRFTHHWGGVLGVPRNLRPKVGIDRATGLAWGGGYIGAGVAAANAAGRTLADLICEVDSDLVRLPWVGRSSRTWEPEPLRWLGVHAVASLAHIGDGIDARRGRRG
jgi:glycine/D-amino acid oxidase-like deaminating enzyme